MSTKERAQFLATTAAIITVGATVLSWWGLDLSVKGVVEAFLLYSSGGVIAATIVFKIGSR